jgi:hypothetical protein
MNDITSGQNCDFSHTSPWEFFNGMTSNNLQLFLVPIKLFVNVLTIHAIATFMTQIERFSTCCCIMSKWDHILHQVQSKIESIYRLTTNSPNH